MIQVSKVKKVYTVGDIQTVALDDVFKSIGIPLIQIHADDFVSHDHVSGSTLKEVSDLAGIPMTTLALELIGIFAASVAIDQQNPCPNVQLKCVGYTTQNAEACGAAATPWLRPCLTGGSIPRDVQTTRSYGATLRR